MLQIMEERISNKIIILFFGTNIIPSTGIIEKERKKEIFADQYEPVILNEKFISFLPEKEDGNGITIFIYDNIYY